MLTNVKLIGIIAGVVLSAGALFSAYKYVENIGYQKANKECTDKFQKYQQEINSKLNTLQSDFSTLSGVLVNNNEKLSGDISAIASRVKKLGPTTIIKEGKCTPAPVFVDSLNQAIDRVNSK